MGIGSANPAVREVIDLIKEIEAEQRQLSPSGLPYMDIDDYVPQGSTPEQHTVEDIITGRKEVDSPPKVAIAPSSLSTDVILPLKPPP